MLSLELDLFEHLAFCWKHFEDDGLNGNNVQKYLDRAAGRVLIVGSGQGLVASALVKQGAEPVCIDCSHSMARYARERSGIETEVINFIDYEAGAECFDTVLVNTGVLYPAFLAAHQQHFTKKLSFCLRNGGRLLLCFFQLTDFDSTVEEFRLAQDREQLIDIWNYLCDNGSLVQFLRVKFRSRQGIDYLLQRHQTELREYEEQIRNAGRAFMQIEQRSASDPKLYSFLQRSLPYVCYGIPRKEQLELFDCLSNLGFVIERLDSKDKLVVVLLKKESETHK